MLDLNEHIEFTYAFPVSPKLHDELYARALEFLGQYRADFRTMLLHIYITGMEGSVMCTANLFTDQGRFHLQVYRTNIPSAVHAAIDELSSSIAARIALRSMNTKH